MDVDTDVSNIVRPAKVTRSGRLFSPDISPPAARKPVVITPASVPATIPVQVPILTLFTVEIGKQPLILQKVTYLVTRRIDQIDPKTWLIFWGLIKSNDG